MRRQTNTINFSSELAAPRQGIHSALMRVAARHSLAPTAVTGNVGIDHSSIAMATWANDNHQIFLMVSAEICILNDVFTRRLARKDASCRDPPKEGRLSMPVGWPVDFLSLSHGIVARPRKCLWGPIFWRRIGMFFRRGNNKRPGNCPFRDAKKRRICVIGLTTCFYIRDHLQKTIHKWN